MATVEELAKEAEVKLDPKDPHILDLIAQKNGRKIVGEVNNIKFLNCCCLSKDLPRKYRLSTVVLNDSGAGKSNLVNNVTRPFKDSVIDYTAFTNAFLTRQEEGFDGKILKMEQMEKTNDNNQVSLFSLKFLLSEGVLKVGLVERVKGKHESRTLTVEGIPVYISTSTNFNIDPESANRTFLMQVDESKEQTEKIVDFTLNSYSSLQEREMWEKDIKDLEELFSIYQSKGQRVTEIVIPFADKLKGLIPVEDLTIRRDLPKILNLTCVIAFVHFKNRQCFVDTKDSEGQRNLIIVAEPEDFVEAFNIAGSTIRQTLNKMNDTSLSLFQTVKDFIDSRAGVFEACTTIREIAQKTGRSPNRTRELVKILVESGLLMEDRTDKEYKFALTGKDFKEIRLDELTFSLDEFEQWMQKEIASFGDRYQTIERSCDMDGV